MDKILQFIDQEFEKSVERLCKLLTFPSISTDPNYKQECKNTAAWLGDLLKTLDFDVQIHETKGHPILLAKQDAISPDAPHFLFYGHYDVQPVDPLEKWNHPPFVPVIEGSRTEGKIIARGASDDKGQFMTFIEAFRAFKAVEGQLPAKITILLEGEEESGSDSLVPFLKAHREDLQADLAFICDTTMWDEQTPAITLGLRGILAQEIIIHAADRDLHSGAYGGVAANPLTILAKILGNLHDSDGRITIENFYENVKEPPTEILNSWKTLGCDEKNFLEPIGLKKIYGEKNHTLLENLWSRPTAEVNGIYGGYTGDGFKTVIPSQAVAKVSFRLVEGQDPDKICKNFQDFVKKQIPEDCKVSFVHHGGSKAISLPYESSALLKAKQALSEEWNTEAMLISSGGSIPVVGDLKEHLGISSLLIGFALEDDNIHSPNEKYNLRSFYKGQRSWIRILKAIIDSKISK